MMFSVIVATLLRPSLQDLLNSLKRQTLERKEWELITWDSGFNEYDARNQASKEARGQWLAFTDDDCVAPSDWLESAYNFLQDPKNSDTVALTGPLEGDLWGHGKVMRLEKPNWYVGANLFVRKDAFDSLGRFESDWGLSPPPRGWRSDSDLGFRIEDKFGKKTCKFSSDILVYHPRSMQSVWQPEVEHLFYLRHRTKCLERFVPVDPRLCQFILQRNIETDMQTRDYIKRNLEALSQVTN
jgi:glycosyltransferase involved in cell wall biosynthesis